MQTKTTDELLLEIFADLDKRIDFPTSAIRKKVAIISTPRCGSSMFCDVLHKTKVIGNPKEWINMRYLAAYANYFSIKDINLEQFLNFIMIKTTSSNGVFSINFHIEQYIEMLKYGFNVFTLNFDKSYFLYRKAKLDQAYSLSKASINDQWSEDSKSTRELPSEIGRERILQALMHISRSEEYYNLNLKKYVNREFFYEDFSDLNNTNSFSQIMSDLDISNIGSTWTTELKKQRTDTSQREVEVLKEYLGV